MNPPVVCSQVQYSRILDTTALLRSTLTFTLQAPPSDASAQEQMQPVDSKQTAQAQEQQEEVAAQQAVQEAIASTNGAASTHGSSSNSNGARSSNTPVADAVRNKLTSALSPARLIVDCWSL